MKYRGESQNSEIKKPSQIISQSSGGLTQTVFFIFIAKFLC